MKIVTNKYLVGFFPWYDNPSRSRLLDCWGSAITLRHTTLSRNPLGEWL